MKIYSLISVIGCVVISNSIAYGLEDNGNQRSKRGNSSLIEEVIVTAQKREEAVSDIPISIQAFSGDALSKLGVTDTRDLANIVPGLSYSNSGKDSAVYTLRGVGFNDLSRSASSAVGVYIDEAPIAYPYMTQGADVDISRIEVLKGPQGTLYGRNTTGGAINYILNRPTGGLEYGVEVGYSSYEMLSTEGFVSGPLTEKVLGRFALRAINSSEGWQKSQTRPNDRLGEQDRTAARLALDFQTTERLSSEFSLQWWRDQSEPQAPQVIAKTIQSPFTNTLPLLLALHPDVYSHPVVEGEDSEIADWSPELDWTIDNEFWMPTLRTFYDVSDTTTATVVAAYTYFETGKGVYPLSGLSNINQEVNDQHTEVEVGTLELRLDGLALDSRVSWLAGIYLSKDNVNDFTKQRTDTNTAVFNTVPGIYPIGRFFGWIGLQDSEAYAFFANTDWNITDTVSLTLGARYSRERRDFGGCNIDIEDPQGIAGLSVVQNAVSIANGGTGGAEPGKCATIDEDTNNAQLVEKSLDEDNVSGKVALSWRPNDTVLIYGSLSRGFKSGSFPIIPASTGTQYEPVTQEQLDSIEVGGKTEWFDGALKINAAVFDYDYIDKQLYTVTVDPIFGPLPVLTNVPISKIQGAELEVSASPLSGLFLSLAGSYLDTEITEYIGLNSKGIETDFSGRDLPFAPNSELTLLINYSFNIPFTKGLEGTFGADYSYVGATSSAIEEDSLFDIPRYEIYNARFSVGNTDGSWEVTSWVKNIKDEFYQLSTPKFAADTFVRYAGMPRTYGITLSYNYF